MLQLNMRIIQLLYTIDIVYQTRKEYNSLICARELQPASTLVRLSSSGSHSLLLDNVLKRNFQQINWTNHLLEVASVCHARVPTANSARSFSKGSSSTASLASGSASGSCNILAAHLLAISTTWKRRMLQLLSGALQGTPPSAWHVLPTCAPSCCWPRGHSCRSN